MSAVTGNAMRMKLELAALMQKHGYAVEPHFIKSTAPVDYPLDVSGLASTTDIDLGRQKFRGWAFDNLCLALKGYPLPKLLYKHDDDQIAGRITSLGYDDKGRLRISAEVTHPLAKLCSAFSVGAKLNTYEIRCGQYELPCIDHLGGNHRDQPHRLPGQSAGLGADPEPGRAAAALSQIASRAHRSADQGCQHHSAAYCGVASGARGTSASIRSASSGGSTSSCPAAADDNARPHRVGEFGALVSAMEERNAS